MKILSKLKPRVRRIPWDDNREDAVKEEDIEDDAAKRKRKSISFLPDYVESDKDKNDMKFKKSETSALGLMIF